MKSFDFCAIWQSGPWKKVGKVMAQSRFAASVKTEEDWKNIIAARDAYNAYCKANPWYTPVQGSVWFGTRKGWREWIPDDEVEATMDDPLPMMSKVSSVHVHRCTLCAMPHDWLHDDEMCFAEREMICYQAYTEYKDRQKAKK